MLKPLHHNYSLLLPRIEIEGECPTAYSGLLHERVSAKSHVPFYLRILVA